MIKKIICLFGVLFLITGCSANYYLYINEGSISEEISVSNITFKIPPYSVYYDIEGFNENGDKIPGVEYYNMSEDGNVVTLGHIFDWNNYTRSNAAHTCLNSVKITRNEDNNYVVSTSEGFSCFDQFTGLDTINIYVVVNNDYYSVVSSNSDSYSDNEYTWTINKNNYKDRYIQLIINKNKNGEQPTPVAPEKEENEMQPYFWYIMIGSLVALVIIVVILSKYNRRKR